MTEKTARAFNDLYSKALDFKNAEYRIRDMCNENMKRIFQEKYREPAENAVWEALKPFRAEQELEVYKAAKIFVEAYEANEPIK